MLIAWGDDEARGIHAFVTIPLINAFAPFQCQISHHQREIQVLLAVFGISARFQRLNLKYKYVSFLQLSIELRIPIMQKPGEILEQIQRIANDMQNKVEDVIRNSPAQEIEKNVRAMMNQGFQKMDLVTREEFELQNKVLAKTREKLEVLEAKVAALEKQ